MTTNQLMLSSNVPASPEPTSDPYFEYVTMLLHGDGTSGADNNTFLDSSTNNFTITRNGNTTQGSFSPYGFNWSNYFDGSGDWLSLTPNSSLQFGAGNFTAECWVYPTNTSTFQIVFGQNSGNFPSSQFDIRIDAGNVSGIIFYGNAYIQSSITSISQNTWTHLALVRNGTSLILYKNGVSAGSVNIGTTTLNTTATEYRIGAIAYTTPYPFYGYISNIRIVKGTAVYTANFTPSTTPLVPVSGTSLLTCKSNRFIDNSYNNFAITKTGDVSVQRFSPFAPVTTTQNYSAYFDGTNDYLSFPNNAALNLSSNNFTFECWVFPLATTDGALCFINGDTITYAALRVGVYLGQAYVLMATVTGSWAIQSNLVGSVTTNTWNHIAVTRSGTSVKLFINGISVYSGTVSGSLMLGTLNYIGAIYGGSVCNAYISNSRLVNGTALYTSNFTPPTAPLTNVSGTAFLTCQSNTFIDNSSNNFSIFVGDNTKISEFNPFTSTYTAQAYSTSVIGGSAYFDGSGDYLSLASNAAFGFGTGDFTVEGWVYATVSARQDWIDIYTGTSLRVLLYYSGTAISVYTAPPSAIVVTGPNLTLNTWIHLAVSKQSGNLKLFVDGVQAGSTYTTNQNYGSANSTILGKDSLGSTYVTGYMSNIRVTKGTALYTSNFAPPASPVSSVSGTSLLANCTNGGIYDNAEINDVETYNGVSISSAASVFGPTSIRFNASNWIPVPNNPNLQFGTGDFTIECWIRLNSLAANRSIIAKGTGTTGWYWFVTTAGKISFTYTSTTLTCSSTLTTGVWYYISVVRSGTGTGNVKVYLNGVLDGTSAGAVTDNFNQTDMMYIGANRTASAASAMSGYIEDLRITKGYARYTSNYTTPTAAFPDY